MKRKLLICVFALNVFASTTDRIYACCEKPVADFSAPTYICIDCVVSFDASGSYDPDGTQLSYDWNFGSGAYDVDVSDPVHPTCKYSTAEAKTVILEVTDNDKPQCCNGDPNCSDQKSDPNAVETVTVVRVDKVVESGTTDEGPIYLCPDNDTVSLEAEPYPVGASFPSGEPHWSIESQPSGADAQLNPSSGSATTTLSCLTEFGEYVVKAQCGDSDDGDTITVTNELQNETDWIDYPSDDIPSSCSAALCDGEDATIFDDCDNELEVSCAQSDGTGGIGGCAYRYFYNDGLISSCIWVNGYNKWWYKEAEIGDSGLKVFTKARHTTADPDKNDSEGCAGYYCSLVVIYDCITGELTEYWRRDPDNIPWTETDGEGHDDCPGP